MLLHSGFEDYCDAHPDSVALIVPSEGASCDAISFATLDDITNETAKTIINLLGPRSDFITLGVCCRSGFGNVVALLAALKAGIPWVPLDPSSSDRCSFIAKDAHVAIILTDTITDESDFVKSFLSEFHALDIGPFISAATSYSRFPETIKNQASKRRQRFPSNMRNSSDIAYVYYTSGSTGRPKGVLGSHRAMLNRFEWMYKAYPYTAGEVSRYLPSYV